MNKSGLTRRLARASNTTNAEAADYLDFTVLAILKDWKHGQPATWPGLGILSCDRKKPARGHTQKHGAR